jgi:hypothetical protein
MKKALNFIAFLLCLNIAYAQCEVDSRYDLDYQSIVNNTIIDGNFVVPVKIHTVSIFGDCTTDLAQVASVIFEDINEYFEGSGIQFSINPEQNCIQDEDYWMLSLDEDLLAQLMTEHNVEGHVNIYLTHQLQGQTSFGIGDRNVTVIPTDDCDGALLIRQANFSTRHTTAHALGRYFGLLPTHGTNDKINTSEELVDGSNAATTGDFLTDTPADPNVGGLVDSGCVFYGRGTDANGQLYQPDTNNIMSNSRGCGINFTEQQKKVIYYVYKNILNESLSVNNPEDLLDWKIVPNPATNEIEIIGPQVIDDFVIYDITGRKLMEGNTKQIDISQFKAAFYLINITSGDRNQTLKFFIK